MKNTETPIVVAGFPITPDVSLRVHGDHSGIGYEISNHGRDSVGRDDGSGTWCYYVYISEKMLPPELFEQFWLAPKFDDKGRASYSYYDAPFAGVDWHCGITFYQKTGGIDGQPRSVKIGCDYNHYWDEGHSYDLEDVRRDAVNTVSQLQAMYPFFVRCPYTGTWQPAADMVEHKGRLWSKDGVAKAEAYALARQS
jgi:hypothetical protein